MMTREIIPLALFGIGTVLFAFAMLYYGKYFANEIREKGFFNAYMRLNIWTMIRSKDKNVAFFGKLLLLAILILISAIVTARLMR